MTVVTQKSGGGGPTMVPPSRDPGTAGHVKLVFWRSEKDSRGREGF